MGGNYFKTETHSATGTEYDYFKVRKFLAGLACGLAWKYDLLYNEIKQFCLLLYIWGCLGVTEVAMDVKIDL